MKPKTATIMVIAVSPKGHHRAIGGAPSHSACGCEEADNNAPMISIPIEALSSDEVVLDDVRGVLKKLDNGEAYIEIRSVNGMPAEYESKEDKKEMAGPMDKEGMRKMAEEYDSEMEG